MKKCFPYLSQVFIKLGYARVHEVKEKEQEDHLLESDGRAELDLMASILAIILAIISLIEAPSILVVVTSPVYSMAFPTPAS